MANKRSPNNLENLVKTMASIPKPSLAGSSERKHNPLRYWPTARLLESLAVKKRQVKELKKTDPHWRLWGIGPKPGAAEKEAARLEREIQEIDVERVRRNTDRHAAAAAEPDSVQESTPPDFKHSDDFRTIQFKGDPHELTSRQAQVVQLLFEAHESRMPALHKDQILEKLETRASRLRDTFKRSSLWGTLIVPGKRKGTYQLNL